MPKRPLPLLLALIWVPFLAIFGFAAPVVVDAIGDSYPHMAFHVISPVLLTAAWVLAGRLLREMTSRAQRILLWTLSVTLPLAVLGNLVELAAAVRRFVEDGWVSRRTEDLFGAEGGLHAVGANLTIPAHMASLVVGLGFVVVAVVQRRRHLEPLETQRR